MLTGDTLISMNDGTKCPIHLVRLNQRVKSYDTKHQDGIVKSIAAFVTTSVIKLRLSNGKSITCSANLKFSIKKVGWVEADFLEYGMEFITDDNQRVSLIGISYIEDTEIELYNLLSVEPHKTFFCNGILVHNGCFVTRGTRISKLESNDLIENSHIHHDVISHNNMVSTIHVSKVFNDSLVYIIKFLNSNSLIGVGANQYFYVNNKFNWVRTDEISIGDSIRMHGGDDLIVQDVELIYDNTDDLFYITQENPQSTFFINGFLTTTNNSIKI